MQVSLTLEGVQQESSSSMGVINWNDFDLRVGKLSSLIFQGTVDYQVLHGTQLSCAISLEAQKWKNRKIFIEKTLVDIIGKCPKDEPLALISLGSDRLLIEYIVGKTLLEKGFSQLSFFLVDPSYAFSPQAELDILQKVFKDFRNNIELVYSKINKQQLAKERIRFLSRNQNISHSFPANANVAVIESCPPYAEVIKEMQKAQVRVKSPQDLMMSGRIVPAAHANAIALIPAPYAKQMINSGAKLTDSLPLLVLQTTKQERFYLDWGCKIKPDGTYCLTFTGEDHYLDPLGVPSDKKIGLSTGEVVQAGQWVPVMKQKIEEALSEKIKSIKGDDSQKQLSQANLTELLEKVKEIAALYMPGINCFFSADYVFDRDAAMAFLSTHASHHYRKTFSLEADPSSDCKVSILEFLR